MDKQQRIAKAIKDVIPKMMDRVMDRVLITDPFIKENHRANKPLYAALVPDEIFKGSHFERRFVTPYISCTHPHEPRRAKAFRRITKSEACLIQGFSEDFKLPESRAKWMKLIGNSVSVPVIDKLCKAIIETGVFENSQPIDLGDKKPKYVNHDLPTH
jgi:site-specific DNA-cytosine methylase